jgi:preprotein translocase subunit SecA
LPIKLVDQNNKSEVKIQHEIIHHVDVLLKLNIELKDAKLQTNVNQLKQRIEHSEDKINQLVYELYDLSEEDIKVIEGQQEPSK